MQKDLGYQVSSHRILLLAVMAVFPVLQDAFQRMNVKTLLKVLKNLPVLKDKNKKGKWKIYIV